MKSACSLLLAFGTAWCLFVSSAHAQATVTGLSGDKEAVWLVTDDNRLIYCWWPQDPSRPDSEARCKAVDRFNLDRLK